MMKLNFFETHDRLQHLHKQADYISIGCQECINGRPPQFENYPFYIFAFKKQIAIDERIELFKLDLYETLINPLLLRKYKSIEEVPTDRLIWSCRLTKPHAQTNSMLFKCYPPDGIRPIWILPIRELWEQYAKGKLIENEFVIRSIYDFEHNRELLESSEEDDVQEERAKYIYEQIALSTKPRMII